MGIMASSADYYSVIHDRVVCGRVMLIMTWGYVYINSLIFSLYWCYEVDIIGAVIGLEWAAIGAIFGL